MGFLHFLVPLRCPHRTSPSLLDPLHRHSLQTQTHTHTHTHTYNHTEHTYRTTQIRHTHTQTNTLKQQTHKHLPRRPQQRLTCVLVEPLQASLTGEAFLLPDLGCLMLPEKTAGGNTLLQTRLDTFFHIQLHYLVAMRRGMGATWFLGNGGYRVAR